MCQQYNCGRDQRNVFVSFLKEAALLQVQQHLQRSGHHWGLTPEKIEDLMTIAAQELEFDGDVPPLIHMIAAVVTLVVSGGGTCSGGAAAAISATLSLDSDLVACQRFCCVGVVVATVVAAVVPVVAAAAVVAVV
jgi:hypothetical protein